MSSILVVFITDETLFSVTQCLTPLLGLWLPTVHPCSKEPKREKPLAKIMCNNIAKSQKGGAWSKNNVQTTRATEVRELGLTQLLHSIAKYSELEPHEPLQPGQVIAMLTIRLVLVGVSPGCHTHLLERHVSKTILFA